MPTSINKRPFFSVIVPCYNSRKTIGRLLNSLVLQDMDFEDLQIVLSDDCSTESYQDIVDKYKSLLNIKQVSTDYNYCPGNTRQRGAQSADGEWMIFGDHDDEFIPGSFKQIQEKILENNFDQIIFTPFYKKQLDGRVIEMPCNAGWTHGKFFNVDNFWKKYHLHYIKDLKSHEDVSMSTQIDYIQKVFNKDYIFIGVPVYVWNEVAESLTNKKYMEESKERQFLDVFLVDYMDSTAGVGYIMYQQHEKTEEAFEWTKENIIRVLLYSYFYFEFSKFQIPDYLQKNCDRVKYYIDLLENEFNTTLQDIYNFFRTQHPDEYPTIFEMAVGQTAEFIYDMSFKEWLNWIKTQKYKKGTM